MLRTTVYRIRLILTPRFQWRYRNSDPKFVANGSITAEDEDIQEEDKEGELAEGELEAHEELEEEEEDQEEEVATSGEAATSRSRSGRRLNSSFRSVEEGY